MTVDWTRAWQPAVDAVGTDFGNGEVTWGADAVEGSAIRRYLEPLEFDCALHRDADIARAHGFSDITMPYTGVLSWTLPALWEPGDPPLFQSDERNAQPVASPNSGPRIPVGPPTRSFFATDIDLEFRRPVVVGEHLGRRGRRLVSCIPKATSLGRGAFLTFETEIVVESGEVVGYLRTSVYAYDPHPERTEAP